MILLLISILCIFVYRIGKRKGEANTKAKIHKALINEDPLYSLGKLNAAISKIEREKEPSKFLKFLKKITTQ